MSRIGKMPITIPNGVRVEAKDGVLFVEGPKGKLSQAYRIDDVELSIADGKISLTTKNDTLQTSAYHGLYRSLFNNMIKGVSEGFSKSLLINGVGYRAEVQGKLLMLTLGYSNDFFVTIPDGIEVKVEQLKITVSGISKELVGHFASQIRALRLTEPYKGKGIRYEDEVIKRKVGKSGVK
jgi:ribosomal protein L6, bacterial type